MPFEGLDDSETPELPGATKFPFEKPKDVSFVL